MADSVQLTDLDVIARYSIAVRSATADRDELVETLRADLAWLEHGRSRTSTFRAPAETDEVYDEESVGRPAVRSTRPTARKTVAKKTAARRTPR